MNTNRVSSLGIIFFILIFTGTAYAGIIDGEKDIFFGGETWIFDPNTLTATSGTQLNVGASNSPAAPVAGTHNTLARNAYLFSNAFSFLSLAAGSSAWGQYGAATRSASGGGFSIFFPTLEMQWANQYIPLNSVTINCNDIGAGNFDCFGEHSVTVAESIDMDAFLGTTFQWLFSITGYPGNSLTFYSDTLFTGPVPSQIFTQPFQAGNEFRIVEGTISNVPLPASIYLFLAGCFMLFRKSFHQPRALRRQ